MPEEIPIARAGRKDGAQEPKALEQSSVVSAAFDEDILSDIEDRLAGGEDDQAADYSPRDKVELDKADLPLEFEQPAPEEEPEPPEVEVDLGVAVEAPDEEAAPEAPPAFPQKNLKLVVAAGALAVVALVAVVWMVSAKKAQEPKIPTPWIYSGRVPNPETSLRLDLEPFLVQLAAQGGDRILKVSVSLEVMRPEDLPSLRRRLMACRDVVYQTLSRNNASDLSTIAGKDRARAMILAGINQVMGGVRVHRVYFTKFVIEG